MCDRAQREREEGALVVVAADAVGLERAAARATVYESPLAILADLNGDGLHRASACAPTVARLVVEMTRPEAARAMVSVFGAKAASFDRVLAYDADKRRIDV